MSGNRFVVDLGKLELDKNATARIERAIQDVVLRELNDLRGLQRPIVNRGIHFPKEWLGIWINDIELPEIKPPRFVD
jgi:hypothetical protein